MLLERVIAKSRSVSLSVHPSVCHTRQPRLRGSTYRNTFRTVRLSDIFSILMQNLIVLSLGVHPKRV